MNFPKMCKHCFAPIRSIRGAIDQACDVRLAKVDKVVKAELGHNGKPISLQELRRLLG